MELPDGDMPAQMARTEQMPADIPERELGRVAMAPLDNGIPAQMARTEQMPAEMPERELGRVAMAPLDNGMPAQMARTEQMPADMPERELGRMAMAPLDNGVPAQMARTGEMLPEGTTAAQVSGERLPEGERATPAVPASGSGDPAEPGGTSALSPRIGTLLQSTTPAQSTAPGSGSGGGAGQGFQVSPGQYGAAVSPMLAASEAVAALYASLNSYLPSMESQAPWGKDESGKQFSEGDKGYLKYSADTLKALKGMPDGLKYIADGLKAMADGYEGADSSVGSDLNSQGGQGGSGGSSGLGPPPAYSPPVHTPISPSITLEHMNQSGRH
ncbi:hypothetical protein [Kitasatospora kazusensis]|uniref:hypothetical protein n=1 Tax=Kitasatospora kazusensis TaxID=407974 RepID=UPI0031DF6658